MTVAVKICGLSKPDHVAGAVAAGARYLGFNFFPKSPRYVSPEDARDLTVEAPPGVAKVGLVVDLDDAALDAITRVVPLDMIQLHGHETPQRVADVKARYGLPVMKVIGVADEADLADLDAYQKVSDQILVDAKPPKDATLPGGNGITFDWRLVSTRRWSVPWMLAGGLTPDNVAEAVALTGASQVDAASGIETSPGHKDDALMRAFVQAAQR